MRKYQPKSWGITFESYAKGMNTPMHWLKSVPKLHKHILEKHPTAQLNYI